MTDPDRTPPDDEISPVLWRDDLDAAEWSTIYLMLHISDDLPPPDDAPSWWASWLRIYRQPGIAVVIDAMTAERADRVVAAVTPEGAACRLDEPGEISQVSLMPAARLPSVLTAPLDGCSKPPIGDRRAQRATIDSADDASFAAVAVALLPSADRFVKYGSLVGHDDTTDHIGDLALVHDDRGWWQRTSGPEQPGQERVELVLEPVGPDEIIERLQGLVPRPR